MGSWRLHFRVETLMTVVTNAAGIEIPLRRTSPRAVGQSRRSCRSRRARTTLRVHRPLLAPRETTVAAELDSAASGGQRVADSEHNVAQRVRGYGVRGTGAAERTRRHDLDKV
jgi:hypothetical protein